MASRYNLLCLAGLMLYISLLSVMETDLVLAFDNFEANIVGGLAIVLLAFTPLIGYALKYYSVVISLAYIIITGIYILVQSEYIIITQLILARTFCHSVLMLVVCERVSFSNIPDKITISLLVFADGIGDMIGSRMLITSDIAASLLMISSVLYSIGVCIAVYWKKTNESNHNIEMEALRTSQEDVYSSTIESLQVIEQPSGNVDLILPIRPIKDYMYNIFCYSIIAYFSSAVDNKLSEQTLIFCGQVGGSIVLLGIAMTLAIWVKDLRIYSSLRMTVLLLLCAITNITAQISVSTAAIGSFVLMILLTLAIIETFQELIVDMHKYETIMIPIALTVAYLTTPLSYIITPNITTIIFSLVITTVLTLVR